MGTGFSLPRTAAQQAAAARWPEIWRLPDLTTTDSGLVASLTDAEAPWKVALIGGAAELAQGSCLALVPDLGSTSPTAPGAKEPIASLRVTPEGAVFSWVAPHTDAKMASQIENCLLEFNDGKQLRLAQLREPMRTKPLSVDLALDKQAVEAEIINPPKGSALYLEITDLKGFPGEVSLRGSRNSIGATAPVVQTPAFAALPSVGPQPAGLPTGFGPSPGMGPGPGMGLTPGMGPGPMLRSDALVIEFADNPALEIQVALTESRGKIAITIDPVFRDEGKPVELSVRQIGQIEEDAKKDLVSAQRELEESQPKLRHWVGKLKGIEGSKPAPTSVRYGAWAANYSDAKSNADRYQRAVDTVNARLDKTNARIDAALKAYKLLKDPDQHATIHYVVYSECGATDVLLIEGRGQQ